MRISRVFLADPLVVGELVELDKSRSHYLNHVLRLGTGADVIFFNGKDGVDYLARLLTEGKRLKAEILDKQSVATESPVHTEIIQGLGRSDHMDLMIQKTTELGVNRIILFNAERTQSPLKQSQLDKKLQHWHSVACSACEQCGRNRIPVIEFNKNLDQALNTQSAQSKFLLEFESEPLACQLSEEMEAVSVLLGPEGGLSDPEIAFAADQGFRKASLGPRVLRTETAAITALAILQAGTGDLG